MQLICRFSWADTLLQAPLAFSYKAGLPHVSPSFSAQLGESHAETPLRGDCYRQPVAMTRVCPHSVARFPSQGRQERGLLECPPSGPKHRNFLCHRQSHLDGCCRWEQRRPFAMLVVPRFRSPDSRIGRYPIPKRRLSDRVPAIAEAVTRKWRRVKLPIGKSFPKGIT